MPDVTRKPVSRRLRFEILRRDLYRCRYCGTAASASELTVDHVIPVALGGKTEPANLVATCHPCNSGKASTLPDAPAVEQVRSDALRWAAAMCQAAGEAMRRADQVSQAIDDFEDAWLEWRPEAPRPDGWEDSIARFVALGLPVAEFPLYVSKAMRRSRTRSEAFQYFCGCCWAELRDMQARALEILDEEDADGEE